MTRDMDLIRELLLKLEGLPLQAGTMVPLTGHEPELAIEGYSGDQIEYHLELLKEADFIECSKTQPMQGVTFRRLTWHGHDFLDSVRSPETWKKTKEGAKKIGSWSVDLLLDMAKAYGKHLAKEKLGLDL